MKTLLLWRSFLKNNFIPVMIAIALLTVASYLIVGFYGRYKFQSYARDTVAAGFDPNGVYFAPEAEKFQYFTEDAAYKPILSHKACASIFGNAESHYAVVDGAEVHVYRTGGELLRSFTPVIAEGRWLSPSAESTEAVVSGINCKPGERITLSPGEEATVVGVIDPEKLIVPRFNSYGGKTDCSYLFSPASGAVAFVASKEQPELQFSNYYVVFDKNAGAEDIAALEEFLSENGSFTRYAELIENSNENLRDWLSRALPLPLFLTAVATLTVICISIVVIKRGMNEYSKYYIIGCTRAKAVSISAAPLVLLSVIPLVFNLVCVLAAPTIYYTAGKATAIIGVNCVVPVAIYTAFVASILFFTPFAFYAKSSPLEIYRRNL